MTDDLTAEQIDAFVAKAGGADQVHRVLSGELDLQLLPASSGQAPEERIVTVTPALDFEERIARGRYGWRHVDLTEDLFPITDDPGGEVRQKLFHFNRSISSEEAIRLIGEDGFEPAKIGDILVFGEHFPEVQRRHPVIGLGSVADVDLKPSVPALWFDGDRRTLDLIWYDGDWHRNYRFLGVRAVAHRL
jgi:hypothetical protein